MKTIIRQSILTATFILAVITAQAKGTAVEYSRAANSKIGITAGNQVAVGGLYKITDRAGNIVLQGRIQSADTFYIPVSKLGNGTYTFSIDGFALQAFAITN
jgi:hypothetical protein